MKDALIGGHVEGAGGFVNTVHRNDGGEIDGAEGLRVGLGLEVVPEMR